MESLGETHEYADEHENGQLRIAVAGEQMPLLPLPDELIPQTRLDSDPNEAPYCPR